jgi:hypothetical protein
VSRWMPLRAVLRRRTTFRNSIASVFPSRRSLPRTTPSGRRPSPASTGGTDTHAYDAPGAQTSRTEAGQAHTQTVNGVGQLVSVQNTTSGETWASAYDRPAPCTFTRTPPDVVLRARDASGVGRVGAQHAAPLRGWRFPRTL